MPRQGIGVLSIAGEGDPTACTLRFRRHRGPENGRFPGTFAGVARCLTRIDPPGRAGVGGACGWRASQITMQWLVKRKPGLEVATLFRAWSRG